MEALNSTTDNTTLSSQYNLSITTWAAYMAFSVLLILAALYVFLALLRYTFVINVKAFVRPRSRSSVRVERDNGNNSSSLGNGRERSGSSADEHKRKRSDETGKAAKPLKALCLLASLFAVLRIGADQLELATYGEERINCKIYQVVVIVTYALSATCNYSALWIRLRIFFNHPIMKHLASFSINFLIWLALALILGSSLLNTLIFVLTVMSVDSPKGCVLGETTSISPTLRYIILTLTTVASQGMLLGLFLYPLLKHRTTMKGFKKKNNKKHPRVLSIVMQESKKVRKTVPGESDSDASPKNKNDFRSFRKSKRERREKRLLAIMWRVLTTALVCVCSDVIAAVVTIALSEEPRVVTNMVFNFNLLINIISVLLSFGDWKERLAPCFDSKSKESTTRRSSTNAAQIANAAMQKEATNNNDTWRPCMDSVASMNQMSSSPVESSKHDDMFTDSRDDMASS